MNTKFLDQLDLPGDLSSLSTEDMEFLSSEIRDRLIDIGNVCGGHLASNLGVVELTVVLHALFQTPTDKFFWDTSHQTYVHKMLTGRLQQMYTIRQDGGLSGFTKMDESPHDAFGAGHASTALSAALGAAQSRDLLKQKHSVVSIIGDASLSGGMSFEALNNAENLGSNFICILNDNNMSISRPVGKMADLLTRIRTTTLYDKTKLRIENIIKKIPKIGVPLKRRVEKTVDHLRDILLDTKAGVIFEEFGFKYLGPIDGHNIPLLMAAIRYAKYYPGPILIHIITQKGRGHSPAENDPIKYHGISPKKKPVAASASPPSFSQTFGNQLIQICQRRQDVVVITPAMTEGSGLVKFSQAFPKRFFDVGIAEEHAVTYAAGLASTGTVPVLAIYSTFLQRGYDQVIHDVCIQNLKVIFALDRSGISGQDGPTHQGTFDYAFLIHIPNLKLLAPKDPDELERMLDWVIDQDGPSSIRYPKAHSSSQNGLVQTPIRQATAEILFEPPKKTDFLDVLIIGVGTMAWPCVDAAKRLVEDAITTAVINLRFIKPLDKTLLSQYVKQAKLVVVVEEGCEIGGVFSYILQQLSDLNKPLNQFLQLAIPDQFVEHGKIATLKEKYGLSTPQIVAQIKTKLQTQVETTKIT